MRIKGLKTNETSFKNAQDENQTEDTGQNLEYDNGVGTPLLIDDATKARLFGIYAWVLVDVDMSGKLYDSVLVEKEGHTFPVEIQYERCHTPIFDLRPYIYMPFEP